MSKKNLVLSLVITTLIALRFFLVPILAASPSPSSSPSPSPLDESVVTENIKSRLKETLSSVATPSATVHTSFVGVIRDVIKSTLILEDKDDKKKVMISSDATILRSPGNATIKADDIRIDDYVIALGTLKPGEEGELIAKRVIVSTTAITNSTKFADSGKITKLTKNTLTLAPLKAGEEVTLTVGSSAKLKTNLGESLVLTDLSVGDSVIYTAQKAKDSSSLTTLMRIGFADPESSASPSATPKGQ